MTKVYLSLGTNLGDKEGNLRTTIHKIEERIGKVTSLSALYVTQPWGFCSENSFLNAAAEVETTLLPLELLQATQEIEREVGRINKSKNGIYADRLIDIDILLYENSIFKAEQLTLPHPLMHLRKFVLKPLCEIAPNVKHPVEKKTISQLLAQLPDNL